MTRGPGGAVWDRLVFWGFIIAALGLMALFAWRGNWAAVLWGR